MIETLLVIIGAVGSLLVALFVLSRDTRQWANRIYALLTAAFVVLMVANLYTFRGVLPADDVLLCIRIVIASTTVVLTLLYFLLRTILSAHLFGEKSTLPRNTAILLFSLFVVFLNVSPLVFESITLGPGGLVSTVAIGPAMPIFVAHSLLLLGLSVARLMKNVRKSAASQRAQSRTILIGIAPTLIMAPITSFVLPVLFGQTAYVGVTPVYVVFFISAVAYAMIRHSLFDIQLAAVRTATYVLTLATLSVVYYVLAYLVSSLAFQRQATDVPFSTNPLNIALALVVAFIFQPIKRAFDQLTNKIFYRDSYDVDTFYRDLNRILSTTSDLRLLLGGVSRYIADTLKSDSVSFFTYYGDSHVVNGYPKAINFPLADAHRLDSYVHIHPGIIELEQAEEVAVRRLLASHKVHLVLPLRYERMVIGYLLLGPSKGSGYTSRDLKTLDTITDELAIAVQNALSVHAVKKLNDHLEQRIASATKELRMSNAQLQKLDEAKDEFISMASHQLRTPLTSIKGYISMLLEGDVGHVSKEQKELLGEVFISSERMVRLIGDFLNVSRLQTGKFVIERHPVNLALLVKREIDALLPNAAARNMTFSYKMPKNIPDMNLDENKIQQVVMNFADNAIYYSKDGGVIKVVLKKGAGCVELTVTDSGIGVPPAEQAQLFSKFFRATNARKARPDGTGVGLFLAKKVVEDHGGTIIFESTEGKGSTFGFRLPLA